MSDVEIPGSWPFPGRRAIALVALLVAVGAGLLALTRPDPDSLPGKDAPSIITIAPDDEPGRRLTLRGRVFAPDGRTPVEGVVLYVYHTDREGRYAPAGQRVPRLRGWVRTGPEGRYEVRTIRPGPYPGRRTPAHVHVFLWGAGYEPQWTESLHFADDPLVDSEELDRAARAGRFGNLCVPEESPDGGQTCVFDIRLKPEGDDFPEEARHGFRGPEED